MPEGGRENSPGIDSHDEQDAQNCHRGSEAPSKRVDELLTPEILWEHSESKQEPALVGCTYDMSTENVDQSGDENRQGQSHASRDTRLRIWFSAAGATPGDGKSLPVPVKGCVTRWEV